MTNKILIQNSLALEQYLKTFKSAHFFENVGILPIESVKNRGFGWPQAIYVDDKKDSGKVAISFSLPATFRKIKGNDFFEDLKTIKRDLEQLNIFSAPPIYNNESTEQQSDIEIFLELDINGETLAAELGHLTAKRRVIVIPIAQTIQNRDHKLSESAERDATDALNRFAKAYSKLDDTSKLAALAEQLGFTIPPQPTGISARK